MTDTTQKSDHETQRLRQSEALDLLRAHRTTLVAKGISGWDLFEQMATFGLDYRIAELHSRCPHCWHDQLTNCICAQLSKLDQDMLPCLKFLILIHHKEYLSAGNSAKLLLRILPEGSTELYIFGRVGDMDRLEEEIAKDPLHSLTLWPGEKSSTIDEYIQCLPADSIWRKLNKFAERDKASPPLLRVIVLDGTYSNAKHIHKALRKRLGSTAPKHVALHPTDPSIFHRAQKQYAVSSAKHLKSNSKLDKEAIRISSAEACALLLKDLGAPSIVQDTIINAVAINNKALPQR